MDIAKAVEFIHSHHRGVLVTRAQADRIQTSPVTAAVDAAGRVIISSRETAFKVRNLERDPRATYCALDDSFFGSWLQVEGAAEVVHLPEAMELLVDYYRLAAGEHPDWDDYRAAMQRDRRVLIRITVERAGPDRAG